MGRRFILTLCAVGLVGGCAQPQWAMEPPKKPTPGAELMKLSRLLGSWSGTAEMVSPSPEEMKATMPEDAEEMPSSFAGAGKAEWTLGGMFLTSEGWHEMGEGERMNYVEYWTWNPKAKKYRTWYFSDWGESGQGWAWFDAADGDIMRFKSTGIDAQGVTKRGKGMMTFTDDDTYDWCWSESGPGGKMKFKGTAKRQ